MLRIKGGEESQTPLRKGGVGDDTEGGFKLRLKNERAEQLCRDCGGRFQVPVPKWAG